MVRHSPRSRAGKRAAACESARTSGSSDDRYDGDNNKDRPDRIEAGETYVMADLKGPGIITHIWLTFLMEPHSG